MAFIMSKMFMYLIFIYRLHIVYTDSIFAYSTRRLFVFAVVVIIMSLFNLLLNHFTLVLNVVYENGNKTCFVAPQQYVLGFTIIFDLSVSVLCFYLFIKPLMILNRGNMDNNVGRIRKVLIKMLSLTFVAVFSTFLFFLLMGATGLTALIAVDIIINSVCIMFFNQSHHYYFKIVCCGTIVFCNRIFNKHQEREDRDRPMPLNVKATSASLEEI
eukprot:UN04037